MAEWGISADVYDIADSGALMDGTDQLDTVQSFIDSKGRGSLFLLPPSGGYAIRDSLKLGRYQGLRGRGDSYIRLLSNDAGKFAITNKNRIGSHDDYEIFLDNFSIIGASDGSESGHTGGASGIAMRGLDNFWVHNLHISNVSGIGIAYQKCKNVNIEDTVTWKTGRDGITGWGLNGELSNVVIRNCEAYWPGDDGFAFNTNESGADGLVNGIGDRFTTLTKNAAQVTALDGTFTQAAVGKRINIPHAGSATRYGASGGFTYGPYEGMITRVIGQYLAEVYPAIPRAVTAINGRHSYNKASNILLEDFKVIGRPYDNTENFGRGVLLAGVDNSTIRRGYIDNTYSSGIYLHHKLYPSGPHQGQHLFNRNCTIEDIIIDGAGRYGSYGQPDNRQPGSSVTFGGASDCTLNRITSTNPRDGDYKYTLAGQGNTIDGQAI